MDGAQTSPQIGDWSGFIVNGEGQFNHNAFLDLRYEYDTHNGTLPYNTCVTGTISMAGEKGEWTFFGRDGRAVTVEVDPGSGRPNGPSRPYIGYVEISLLDQVGNVMGVATSITYGSVITIPDVPLSADATYAVKVRSPVGRGSPTGNYRVTVWDSTPDVYPIAFDTRKTGQIETPYSVDRWEFTATAGQQIRFDLIARSINEIAFDLEGPGGWLGFSDITNDSAVVTLPYSGAYALRSHGTGGQYNGCTALSFGKQRRRTCRSVKCTTVNSSAMVSQCSCAFMFRPACPCGLCSIHLQAPTVYVCTRDLAPRRR